MLDDHSVVGALDGLQQNVNVRLYLFRRLLVEAIENFFNGLAVSRSKCNKLMMMLKEVERLWHKEFGWASKVEAFTWSGIELPGHGIEFGL
jgi:hypothetical protein